MTGSSRKYLLTVIYRDGSQSVDEEVEEEELIAMVFSQLEKVQTDRSVERIAVKLKVDGEEVSKQK